RVALPRRDAVATAIGVVAEERATLLHLRRSARRTLRVQAPVALAKGGVEPVSGPFPDVAGRVVESEAVGGKGMHWAGAVPAVRPGVLERERALPDVHAVLAAGLALVAPGIALSFPPAAGA